jgi:hypothetical protein
MNGLKGIACVYTHFVHATLAALPAGTAREMTPDGGNALVNGTTYDGLASAGNATTGSFYLSGE